MSVLRSRLAESLFSHSVSDYNEASAKGPLHVTMNKLPDPDRPRNYTSNSSGQDSEPNDLNFVSESV